MALFLHYLTTKERFRQQQQRSSIQSLEDEMNLFGTSATATQYLAASPLPSKFNKRMQRPQDDIDDFLTSDLELSFASNVSLDSPPQQQLTFSPMDESPVPMDISPAPFRPPSPQSLIAQPLIRPLAFTNGPRIFGRDRSNVTSQNLEVPSVPKSGSTSSASKRMQRPALPSEWLFQSTDSQQTMTAPDGQASPESEEAMDIDSSFSSSTSEPADGLASLAPISASPTVTGFNSLFFNTISPGRSIDSPLSMHKKRLSLSPERVSRLNEPVSSSPALPSSPSERKFERISSAPLGKLTKATLSGLGAPALGMNKRPPRRPTVSSMVPVVEHPVQSAYPILTSTESMDQRPRMPPVRRAFSAMLPPTAVGNESFSDESSFEGAEMSSPAQAYTKRQSMKTIRRRDGTEDFRPLTGATAVTNNDMEASPSSRFLSAGMPGFGDNEAHGKILPCHRVREDGLMRINCETLDSLLDGAYDDQVADYCIIDCRFDYEYNGGHISGAVNVNTTSAVEEFLLRGRMDRPNPCVSGDPCKKTILVFHCEFSVKRAPTFAKHLRSRDRALNNHVYPRIHFPEVYILEGGYCQYYKESSMRCQPSGYVRMDDPDYASARRGDIDQFRKAKFGRTKSYAYGDGSKLSMFSQAPNVNVKRHTAPSTSSTTLFAAANAARTRRGGLAPLIEDGNTTDNSTDDDTDIGDSPCPPPTKGVVMKGKKLGRAPLIRAETYDPTHYGY